MPPRQPVPAAPPSDTGGNLVAIGQIVLGVMLFSCSDATSKYLRTSLPSVEIAWLRYIVFVAFALALALRHRRLGVRSRRPVTQAWRSVTILGSSVLFIAGLAFMPIADASALSFVSPAFITALSVLMLGERVGVHRWTATLVGLLGVLIVIRPGAGTLQWAALYPLGSSACWAFAMIATRVIGTSDRGEVTLFWTSAIGLALLTVAVPFDFVPLSWTQIGLGLVVGAAATGGQYLNILAYRRASASVLAPFSYVQLLSSTLLGFIVFDTVPDRIAFLGAAVIIASGLYIAARERFRRGAPAAPAAAGAASSESNDAPPASAPSAAGSFAAAARSASAADTARTPTGSRPPAA